MVLLGHKLASCNGTSVLVCCHCKLCNLGISGNACRCCALSMSRYRIGGVVFVVFEVCLLVILRIQVVVPVLLLVPVLVAVDVLVVALRFE